MQRLRLFLIAFLATFSLCHAQLPQFGLVYIDKDFSSQIYTYDPRKPVSASNPTPNAIPKGGAGLAVALQPNTTIPILTFFTVDPLTNKYCYYDSSSSAWINTGHLSGPFAIGNIGAGGGFIYSLAGTNNTIYQYDGTGDAQLFLTFSKSMEASPYDLAADCSGNCYVILRNLTTSVYELRKYSPAATLLSSWTLSNTPALPTAPNGGMTIVDSTLYTDLYIPFIDTAISSFTIGSTGVVHDTNKRITGIYVIDMASYAGFNFDDPDVSITASANPVCAGSSVVFTATPVNAGVNPVFQWTVNGIPTGSNAPTFNYAPANGDTVRCIIWSRSLCAARFIDTSNKIGCQVIPVQTPAIAIAASDTAMLCAGESVTFTAAITAGGSAPSIQWLKNGIPIAGTSGASYTSSGFTNGDVVTSVLTSNEQCARTNTATSNAHSIRVGVPVPAISVVVSPASVVCSGRRASFKATVSDGGMFPEIIWTKNRNEIFGTRNALVYTTTNLHDSDTIRATLISSKTCASPDSVVSNDVAMTVVPSIIPGANVNILPGTDLCAGTLVTFVSNIAGGGSHPGYQWFINNQPVAGATGINFTSGGIRTGDTLWLELRSDAQCATPDTVRSNPVGMFMRDSVLSRVSIRINADGRYIAGQNNQYTAQSTSTGSKPIYQWYRNNQQIPFASDSIYTTGNLREGDRLRVTLQSSEPCATRLAFDEIIIGSPDHVGAETAGEMTALQIAPNPANQKLELRYGLRQSSAVKIEIADMAGRSITVLTSAPQQPGLHVLSAELSGLMAGLYLLRFSTQYETATLKLTITH